MTNDSTPGRDGDEPWDCPSHGGVVDTDSIECGDRIAQVRDTRLMDGADLAFGGAVSAGLHTLDIAGSRPVGLASLVILLHHSP